MSLSEHMQRPATSISSKKTIALALGDTIAFMVFAAIGRASHAEAAGLDAMVQVAETAAPFWLGWMIVAPLLGAYRNDVVSRPQAMAGRTAMAWALACPIGLGLRALIRQSGIPLSFALVTFLTVMVIMLGWRTVFAVLSKARV